MEKILFPVLLVAGIGLILGLILAVVSIVMSAPKDEKLEKLVDTLPGANCGACGFSGCSGYASALAEGKAKPNLCSVGGKSTAEKISKILGIRVSSSDERTAVVKCTGNCSNTEKCMEYNGIDSCLAASKLCTTNGKCTYGCIGFGDCVKACPFNAISICNGIAVIDSEKCKACGKCVATCPQHIIKIRTLAEDKAFVYCSNNNSGANTRKACSAGCISCMRCVKECPMEAIKIENNLACVDASKCIGCGKCTEVCKPGCIKLIKSM